MKNLLQFILSALAFATPLACVVGAIFLAMNGIGGWGWFLLVSVFFRVNVKFG